ncbi:MAG: hypothetical protein A3C85_03425 [Candidatus Doudnabacteria bacterium RIFCSPHIGHO2_02_FULL_48_21]|uniref:Uncharacterized protein n=1 Tax=Candidatus Doudnabacteria bacterium RIFCSPLOWO2_02_FULL_48_13 TaxID=1817845 RepID=A0A1F5QC64_9BACT|nr:MAG: hypothetical protein A3K05_03695 [Candidatus Doudnabacteria bacterium RIFCSPHIGHO2_01_48_18]OGE77341.1 MAG: hypothetical protein A2668_01285 [Candidatus Doudnabacteria bacterium RIFCSPHIGHO2_01_FULL_48_180]OGE91293.1 MAG: hypothetical protein A3F44_03210 [Candidatus Doudnabacteria bacterium RIFCSPHIGHO2_12_FULL_47_25]OGE93291.1 MAG: hypothetical protein A3C85_03425 [Candidatus Doudnabacteria bacterium RIFCSPHIGHO2_02_FULL_48_21]OGE97803.1 MAG: hypothetical protein A3A83_04385 [Candidatu
MILNVKKYFLRFMLLAIAVSMISLSSANAQLDKQQEKDQLQQQLRDIENQIAAYQRELGQIKGQKNTLQNKINQLKKQQAALGLQIKATTLQIDDLDVQITMTQESIDRNTAKGVELKQQLAEFIRLINEKDGTPLLLAVLSQNNFSDVLNQLVYYSELSEGLHSILEEIKQTNGALAQDKQKFEDKQGQARNLLSIQSIQKEQLVDTESEQRVLLDQTRGLESEYQAVLGNTQKKAAEIRNRLYELTGATAQVTFGEAVEIAKWASSHTGVRAAFLLAILTQESNLGKNVGTCNRAGDPPEKSWRMVMKPDRDQQPFQQITTDLGLDIETTPVSCPMRQNGKQVGWGGAMGPAQFIPSTWMGYKDKVAAITGKTADPWDIKDAFLASAIKLKAGGAGTVQGEWAAAMRYFSGGTNPRFRFYGDNVVATANRYQQDIDALK